MATKLGTVSLLALGFAAALGSGCETDDPCARREAACIEVTLTGKRDDGNGNQVAYRNLNVQIFAPNLTGPQTMVDDKCVADHLYGAERGPVGTMLASVTIPELLPASTYAPAVQGKVAFQLPDSFNQIDDQPPADIVDLITNPDAKVAKLKELRDSDPRAVRIIITQTDAMTSDWDSRCFENVFSDDLWTMQKYYRVGRNEDRGVQADLEGAVPSAP